MASEPYGRRLTTDLLVAQPAAGKGGPARQRPDPGGDRRPDPRGQLFHGGPGPDGGPDFAPAGAAAGGETPPPLERPVVGRRASFIVDSLLGGAEVGGAGVTVTKTDAQFLLEHYPRSSVKHGMKSCLPPKK